jgi:hypothetical protein
MGILGEPTMSEEVIHNFTEQLDFAQSKEGNLDSIYRRYFKNVIKIETIDNKSRQNSGIDRQVTLQSGETITTQEKWRKREFTNDLLIEYCSVYRNDECKKSGWIYHIDADYIFTVYAPSQKVLIYPVVQLKLAWDEYEKYWLKTYPKKVAHNNDYDSLNVPIPCNVLEKAIQEKMQFNYQQTLFNY